MLKCLKKFGGVIFLVYICSVTKTNNMNKVDFKTNNSWIVPTFEACLENDTEMYIVGVQGESITLSETFHTVEDVFINSEGVILDEKNPAMIEEYYTEKYDFYFIFPEEDERNEFIEENNIVLIKY